ncbi:hypothetical protein VNO77_04349 [Canavalia gladiata]|uniref:Uncharacterized protein n=1 Tax=Canavalia gladiata TaxID=3824 RepID=A0AAN9R4Q6_CANGL
MAWRLAWVARSLLGGSIFLKTKTGLRGFRTGVLVLRDVHFNHLSHLTFMDYVPFAWHIYLCSEVIICSKWCLLAGPTPPSIHLLLHAFVLYRFFILHGPLVCPISTIDISSMHNNGTTYSESLSIPTPTRGFLFVASFPGDIILLVFGPGFSCKCKSRVEGIFSS